MGNSYICKCNNCGYTLNASFGVGLMDTSVVADEIKTMKIGGYGEQGKRFFNEHPDGTITCNYVVTRCTKCGALESIYDFDLLIPDPELEPQRQMALKRIKAVDSKCKDVSGRIVKALTESIRYILYEKYEHFCSKCGNRVEIIEDFSYELKQGKIICPECGESLYQFRFLLWD